MKRLLLLMTLLLCVSIAVNAQTPEEEALRRIEDAAESGATELDFTDINLTELPERLFALTQLEQLNLSNNILLKELPAAIGDLTALKVLDLTQNPSLEALPDEIRNLTNLEALYLWENYALETLPETFSNLSSLRVLYLDEVYGLFEEDGAEAFPAVITELPALEELAIRGNNLSRLPPEIGDIDTLTKLIYEDAEGRVHHLERAGIKDEIGEMIYEEEIAFRNRTCVPVAAGIIALVGFILAAYTWLRIRRHRRQLHDWKIQSYRDDVDTV